MNARSDCRSLDWISLDLDELIVQARRAIEAYLNNPAGTDERAKLESSLQYAEQVNSILAEAGLESAQLLSAELVDLIHAMLKQQVSNDSDAFQALIGGFSQLPNYLSRIRGQHGENASLLLLVINDIRSVRGVELLVDEDVFKPAISPASAIAATQLSQQNWQNQQAIASESQQLLEQLVASPDDHRAVLQQLRHNAAGQIDQLDTNSSAAMVWSMMAAVVDAAVFNGNRIPLTAKYVMERYFSWLQAQGEGASDSAIEELQGIVRELLFCIAGSANNARNHQQLFEEFDLLQALHIESPDQLLRLGTPDIDTVEVVVAGLIADVELLKKAFEGFVESPGGDREAVDLAAMAENIKYTMQLVQFHSSAAELDAVVPILQRFQQGGSVSEEQLEDIASSLFKVEAALQSEHLGADRSESEALVLEQARATLATVRAEISVCVESNYDTIGNGEALLTDALRAVPGQLKEVSGVAQMLEMTAFAESMQICMNYFASHFDSVQQLLADPDHREKLEKFVSALRLYESYLAAARQSRHSLVNKLLYSASTELGVETAAPLQIDRFTEESQSDQTAQSLVSTSADVSVGETAGHSAQPIPLQGEFDEDIVEIFLEEAEEVMEEIQSSYPVLLETLASGEELQIIRRAYHTLKGSGRMAGAEHIGDAAWSIESLLNRVIDGAVPLDELRIRMVGEANDFMSRMIEAFSQRVQPCLQSMSSLIERAELLANDSDAVVEIGLSLQPPLVELVSEIVATETADSIESLDQDSDSVSTTEIEAETDESFAKENAVDADSLDSNIVEVELQALESGSLEIQQEEFSSAPDGVDVAASEALEAASSTDSETVSENPAIENSAEPAQVEPPIASEAAKESNSTDADATAVSKSTVVSESTVVCDSTADDDPVADSEVAEDDLAAEPVASVDASSQADQGLQAIFIEEACEQLAVVEAYLAEYANSTSNATAQSEVIPGEAVERAFHTIVGGARIANINEIADALASAETLVGHIRGRQSISIDELHYLEAGAHWLRDFLDTNCINHAGIEALTERFDNLTVASDEESFADAPEPEISIADTLGDTGPLFSAREFLREWRALATPPASYEAMLAEIEHARSSSEHCQPLAELCAVISSAYQCFATTGLHFYAYHHLDKAHIALEDMLNQIAVGQQVEEHAITAALVELLESERLLQEALASDQDSSKTRSKQKPEDSVDDEIVKIFLEESEELVEEVEEGVQQWLNERSDLSYLESLLRPLHTIKGGARMAGLKQVGDASHEFETLLQSADSGDVAINAAFFKKVVRFTTRLTDAISSIAADSSPAAEQADASSNNAESGGSKEEDKRSNEVVRVSAGLLERLVNLAGETSISRSLIEEQISDFTHSIDEVDSTVERLKEQLRRLEIETEAQINFRKEQVVIEGLEEFDPLEMDRYSQLQQLSKSLVESASDLKDLKSTLKDKTRDVETLLLQQARINTELQEGLMRTRTVPLSRSIIPRLRRTVRQVSGELDKPLTFNVGNADGELDRSIVERMVAPLEHVLRNAIDHGIESVETRKKLSKPESGAISLDISREGSDIVIRLSDDGQGIDVAAVRKKAIKAGLMQKDDELNDEEVSQFIFSAGISTAKSVTQISGRGVGMDVVLSEMQDLGGSVTLSSEKGVGTTFTFRVPFTVSMNRALLVSAGGESLAIPLDTIEGIVRVSPYELEEYYGENAADFLYAGQQYEFRYLGSLVNGSRFQPNLEMATALPVLLVRGGDKLVALQVDRLLGSREIVVKSLGPQFNQLMGISGATVLGDGSVVMIADLAALVRSDEIQVHDVDSVSASTSRERVLAMVVDDSVTVRKVTSRLLERQGIDVVTAKDGLDAMEKLEDIKPDFILLDIEMPRLDGFEVVARMRHDASLVDVPVIMITSRTGEKHRQRALSLGANHFLGKPYQEKLLLATIDEVLPEAMRGNFLEQASSALNSTG